jgi:hypothetical protein
MIVIYFQDMSVLLSHEMAVDLKRIYLFNCE